MDVNYKFSNLIGAVYKNGNVLFSPDGNSIISPVGNKISVFDLKNNVSKALNFETNHNITASAITKRGSHMVASDEAGIVSYVNLHTETVIHTFRTGSKIKAMQFSPDERLLAIGKGNDLQVHIIDQMSNNIYYPFMLDRTYKVSTEQINCINFSFDGKLIACGGDDKVTRIVGSKDFKNLFIHPLASHRGSIILCQFLEKSYDLITVCHRGTANVWTSSLLPEDIIEGAYVKRGEGIVPDRSEDVPRLHYDKTKKWKLLESSGSGTSVDVTACQLHPASNILVTAFSNGVFVLHEIPSFSLIHNLRVSEMRVNSLALNSTGDWLALGCGEGSSAQLVVWEWQSETYVMKQQAHSQRVVTAKYSPDGSLLATGAEDGKVKIWDNRTGFCTVTFTEHTSGVTAVAWTQSGRAILSASLDGCVRAHDLKRYRNFRTLVCPEPTQLQQMVVDRAGEIVAAVSKELYNVFIWSLENGRLLDVLSGHASVISNLAINGNMLVTGSWDRTVRMWNIVDSTAEVTELQQEALDVAFSPSGELVAVLTADCVVTFYLAKDMSFVGTIDAKPDVDAGRGQKDLITKKNAGKSKTFTTMAFSPDSNLLLLGGESNTFCLYSVPDRMIMKKFTITTNRSFDGVMLDIKRHNFSEFGNMELIDTSDSEDHEGNSCYKKISLPGTKNADLGERRGRPTVEVYQISFGPTGRAFCVCSTDGVGIYSLDTVGIFDPFQLDSSTSPELVKRAISISDYSTAVMASLRLNDTPLIKASVEATTYNQIELVVKSLPLAYAEKLLKWMADGMVVYNSPNVEFFMLWVRAILNEHGMRMKTHCDMAVLTGVQQLITHHTRLIKNMADRNQYSLKFLMQARSFKRSQDKELTET